MMNIAERHNQHFLKLDQERFKDDWFLDNCHLSEEGEQEKARQIFLALENTIFLNTHGAIVSGL